MEGAMLIPFIDCPGWQAIARRVVEWQQRFDSGNELTWLNSHDADLPINRIEVELELQKWCWQA
jgi:uncharacterized protein YjiS (DUF1127 family)